MIYVASDLHGYDFNKFMKLLKKADFGEDDFLFILGDVIDRGDDGVWYLRWMLSQDNVQLILGNHEMMMLACEFIFDEMTEQSLDSITNDKLTSLSTWMINGAEPTVNELKKLKSVSPDMIPAILDYLKDCPLYELVSVGDKDFLLTHSGLKNFSADRKISSYLPEELLWNRPEKEDKYFTTIKTIFGHTPTAYFGEEYLGRIYETDTWIDIDAGCAMGESPVLLRLDDMKVFKVEE